MNRFVILLILLVLVSCKKEAQNIEIPHSDSTTKFEMPNLDLGKKIFEGKGQCATCHKVSQNVLGPSVKEIVSIYKENNASMVAFLKGNIDPIVDPSQFQIMKINLEITKKMTDQELQSVVNYMYHLSEK